MLQTIEGLNSDEVNVVIKAISSNESTYDDVKFYNLSTEDAKKLGIALMTNKSLTHLDLSQCNTGLEGTKAIAEALKVNKSLTHLELLGCRIDLEGVKAIAESLMTNKSLTSLDLAGNDIDLEGVKSITEALMTNKSLTHLDLSYTNIGPDGTKAIAESLKVNKSLAHLELSVCSLDPEGVKPIAEALKVNKSLTGLNLADSHIGPEGFKAIAEALMTNKSLTILSLAGNDIDLEGVKAITEVLKVNKSLTSLNLASSNIGPEGVKAIAVALKENKSLTSLNFRACRIGLEGIKAIVESLKENKYILNLNMDRYILDNLGTQIEPLLERNRKFLQDAIAIVAENKLEDITNYHLLSSEQKQTLLNNFNDTSEEGIDIYPLELREKFSQSMTAELIERSPQLTDLLNEVVTQQIQPFVEIQASHVEETNAPLSTNYFRDLSLTLSTEDKKNISKMLAAARGLKELMSQPGNILFIKDAWQKRGSGFKDFAKNLETINENKEACSFFMKNPKTLGYFVTLQPDKLEKTLEALRNPDLANILGKSYPLIKEAGEIDTKDLEVRRRLAYVNQVSPNLRAPGESLKSLLTSPDQNFAERVRQRNNSNEPGQAR